MAARNALVLISGSVVELPAGDTLVSEGPLQTQISALQAAQVPSTVGLFASRAAASAATISLATFSSLECHGYATEGDGPRARYKNVTEDGSTLQPWQFRSNGGTVRWQLDEVSPDVEMFGAVGDQSTDCRAAINNAIIYVSTVHSGGTVYARGRYRVTGPVVLLSYVVIEGMHPDISEIKASATATFSSSTTHPEGVVMSAGFTPDLYATYAGTPPTPKGVAWNFYPDSGGTAGAYPTGVLPTGIVMGCGLRNIRIDGNQDGGVANAHGVLIYGGKMKLHDVAIGNVARHGLWTECALPGDSALYVGDSHGGGQYWSYVNIHEGSFRRMTIWGCKQRGWMHKGPNDSYADEIIVKNSGWAGFWMTNLSSADGVTPTCAPQGLKMGRIHVYGANTAPDDTDGYAYRLLQAKVQFAYVDSTAKGGVWMAGGGDEIAQIEASNMAHAGGAPTVLMDAGGQKSVSLKILCQP